MVSRAIRVEVFLACWRRFFTIPWWRGKNHGGYAVNWFFGISSNYQATQARWGWGGSRGVSLPEPLLDLLRATRVTLDHEDKSLLTCLEEYRETTVSSGTRTVTGTEHRWEPR